MSTLEDTTFIIPFKLDCQERLRNLGITVNYILKNFVRASIIVGEEDCSPKVHNLFAHISMSRVRYLFNAQTTPFFYRTKLLNKMLRMVETPIVSNYDCDILLQTEQYVRAEQYITSGKYDFVYPYENMYDTEFIPQGKDIIEAASKEYDISKYRGCRSKQPMTPTRFSVGGCFFARKESYLEAGGENENFIKWGGEDLERHSRFEKLGYRLYRDWSLPLYHLNHPRTVENYTLHPEHREDYNVEYKRVTNMSKQELKNYVKTWNWVDKKEV